jgi:hypothetical protein
MFRYCLSRMAPDGPKRKRLTGVQAAFQGGGQGPPAHGHHRHRRIPRLSTLDTQHHRHRRIPRLSTLGTQHHWHRRIPRLSTLGTHHEHPAHCHSSHPCHQRTGPSPSPSPSVSIVRLDRCLGYEHLSHHSSLVGRTTPWLLLDSWPHHKQ